MRRGLFDRETAVDRFFRDTFFNRGSWLGSNNSNQNQAKEAEDGKLAQVDTESTGQESDLVRKANSAT